MANNRSTFTAGAVPVRNAKGELSMQKVKVTRYVAGKKPEYAPEIDFSSDEENEHAINELPAADADVDADYADVKEQITTLAPDVSGNLEHAPEDDADKRRRLARLLKTRESSSESDEDDRSKKIGRRYERKAAVGGPGAGATQSRQIAKAEIVSDSTGPLANDHRQRVIGTAQILPPDSRDLDDDDDIDVDNERERLRRMLRQKVDAQQAEENETRAAALSSLKSSAKISVASSLVTVSDSKYAGRSVPSSSASSTRQQPLSKLAAMTDEDSDETDEADDDDDEEADTTRPRLKPVFVRRKDRITRQDDEQTGRQKEQEQKRLEVERQKEAQRMVQQAVRQDIEEQQQLAARNAAHRLDSAVPDLPVIDDNADEEAEYEAWRVRELGRIKRDRDEREKWRLAQAELERLREMSAEERERELASKPKQIVNKPEKGKMRFMQRYYHRGVFYLNKDEKVLQRDVTLPTLEDQFDRAAMPRILQVKNFGKSGRSKWTHLAAEDTSRPDAAWAEMTQLNRRFTTERGGGFKQVFERPSAVSSNKRKNEHG